MIFRAIFWIGLVSFLIPHEPDLGFGRPGAALSALISPAVSPASPAAPASIGALIQSTSVADTCAKHTEACAGGLSILDGFQSMAIRSMDEVRADLAANRTKLH